MKYKIGDQVLVKKKDSECSRYNDGKIITITECKKLGYEFYYNCDKEHNCAGVWEYELIPLTEEGILYET